MMAAGRMRTLMHNALVLGNLREYRKNILLQKVSVYLQLLLRSAP